MVPSAVAVVVAVVLGFVVGSFLNVVIWRVPRGESVVRPASRCTSCGAPVRPIDNIPLISWFRLRGRCRCCHVPIGLRYPVVEATTAAMFGVFAWHLHSQWLLPPFLYLAAVGIALAFIDFDTHRLPNALTLPSYGVGALLLIIAAVGQDSLAALGRAAIGMVVLFSLYFALMLFKPGGMGYGDVKLAGVLGMFLGYLGWGPLLVGSFLAFFLGGVGGVTLMLRGKAARRTKIPFGPYMVAGAFIGVVAGAQLAHAYSTAVLG